jgi:hypothetical protein
VVVVVLQPGKGTDNFSDAMTREMSCKLTLYDSDLGTGTAKEITESGAIPSDFNDRTTSVKMTGDCINTAWALMEDGESDGYGNGIIIGKGDQDKILNINDANHHGEGKGSTNHRFYKWNDKVSHVQKIDVPTGKIQKDIRIYGKRLDQRRDQWAHYPYVNASDFQNPNSMGQWISGSDNKGKPCPGGKGYPIGHRTFRCIYETGAEIQGLHSGLSNAIAGDPRRDMYGEVVKEFCKDVNNINEVVGGGMTCENFGANRVDYCKQGDKIQKDPGCTKGIMGETDFNTVAAAYCASHPNDKWCSCYNLVNDVCSSNMNAAGCQDAHKYLDDNKDAFGIVKEVEDAKQAVKDGEAGAEERLAAAKAKNGYSILKSKTHCRPYACKDGFIPSNSTQGCDPSYNICDKDIDIRNSTNTDIIIACNADFRPSALPDWWDDPFDESFFDKDRVFPYTRFPLNKTPMYKFPKKFIWKSENVRYHVFSGVGLVSMCCLCLIILVMMMRR